MNKKLEELINKLFNNYEVVDEYTIKILYNDKEIKIIDCISDYLLSIDGIFYNDNFVPSTTVLERYHSIESIEDFLKILLKDNS